MYTCPLKSTADVHGRRSSAIPNEVTALNTFTRQLHQYVPSQPRYINFIISPDASSSHDIVFPISLYTYTCLFFLPKNSRQAVVMHKRHA